jgi:hypothetical protein
VTPQTYATDRLCFVISGTRRAVLKDTGRRIGHSIGKPVSEISIAPLSWKTRGRRTSRPTI